MASFQAAAAAPPSSIPLVLLQLADPPARHVDAALMDYFVIEMVNTLRISSAVATARSKRIEKEMVDSGLLPPLAPGPPAPAKKESARDSTSSLRSVSAKPSTMGEEDEAMHARLEAIGVHVGSNITEKLCKDRSLFPDTLDAIKFICKDIWAACWDKQVDNLRTNHRGIYVLQDNSFRPIVRVSSWDGPADTVKKSKLYTAYPSGIIKGALARLGYQAVVVPEVVKPGQCSFQVRVLKGQ